MLEVWARGRWWLAIRGVIAIVFGAVVLTWPGKTLYALLLAYGIYALADGLATFVLAVKGGRSNGRDPWRLLLIGIFGVAAGVATVYWAIFVEYLTPELPDVTPQLIVLVGWSIARGLYELAVASRLRKEIEGERLFGAAGLLSIVFGVLLALQFAAGLPQLYWLIGLYGLAAGILYVALNVRLSHFDKDVPQASGVAR